MTITISHPLVFEPLFMERIWGGRMLESVYGKEIPAGLRIGESWEIVDREEAQSVVHLGPLRGLTFHELWTERRAEIFGSRVPDSERFPLLFKLLDAQERLSVQVHPPAAIAPSLNGEPKTEMWYFLATEENARVYAGLKQGVTREQFEQSLQEGEVADCVHQIPVQAGEALFIQSGRIHAIGSGNLICEVQQNSDTTYRVFDWNRPGTDGLPRALHIAESMASIDFDDVEPTLESHPGELVTECEYFRIEKWAITTPRAAVQPDEFAIFTCLSGEVACAGMTFQPGDFFLVPAVLAGAMIEATSPEAAVLRTTIPVAV
jgi:mannose-6-phosphate isomerase